MRAACYKNKLCLCRSHNLDSERTKCQRRILSSLVRLTSAYIARPDTEYRLSRFLTTQSRPEPTATMAVGDDSKGRFRYPQDDEQPLALTVDWSKEEEKKAKRK